MDEEIADITVLGAGDSGLLTALCLRKLNPEVDISVVDDFGAQSTDVGKSTFQGILTVLHDFLEIPQQRFIGAVKPVFKLSVYFRDWCGYPAFHFPFDTQEIFLNEPTSDLLERYYHLYDVEYTDPDYRTRGEEIVERGKCPFYFADSGELEAYPHFAYHLNTERFNGFLQELCEERHVSLIDDAITDVETEDGRVAELRGEDRYTADLYVDASGFSRMITRELDSEYIEFGLPLDAAFNAGLDRPLSEVVPATVVETGDYGWFWQIDTFDNRDVGYVFSSEYVDDDVALAEFVDHFGGELSEGDVRSYEFSSGYYEQAWVENCVTIGNAEGFVEPLQSTGLTANARAAQVLSALLAGHGTNHPGIRSSYNAYVRNSWESIYDFISVHYAYASGTNEFWTAMSSIPTTSRTDSITESFDENGITISEHALDPLEHEQGTNTLLYFPTRSFYWIMRRMGATSSFYEERDIEVSETLRDERQRLYGAISDDVEENYLTTEEFYSLVDTQPVGRG